MDFNPPIYLCDSAASFQGFSQDSNLLGMSLQDMIDSDIKAEFDDISCGNTRCCGCKAFFSVFKQSCFVS